MNQNLKSNKRLIYIIPVIVIIWSFFRSHLMGPFYLSRIDPEYPYLLNGLNCSLLEFVRIGHTDHPGTPFQMITGLFIQITYWFVGQGSIVEDVISRPELYLSSASSFLAILTAVVVLWLGRVALNSRINITGVLILQLSMFFTNVLIDIPSRYIPDRILALYTLIFVGFCIKYFYRENYSVRRFAFQSGIIMGIGFVTKFNFLPLMLVPLIVVPKMRHRIIYLISLFFTVVFAFIPIHHKFHDYKNFIIGIVKHDGMYGQGAERIIDFEKFLENTYSIFQLNPSMSIVLLAVLVFVIILLIRSDIRKKFPKEFLMLIAIIAVMLVSVVLTAKHFKNYYLIPIMSLTGFAIIIIWKINRQLKNPVKVNYIIKGAVIVLIIIPFTQLYPSFVYKKEQNFENQQTSNFIKNHISPEDYILVEPTWLPGPLVENGLVYGVSYVGYRHYYYNDYKNVYPNLYTWEGDNKPISFFRIVPANNESLLKSGKNIYVLYSPGRNAPKIIKYLNRNAAELGMDLIVDTVFINSSKHEYLMRVNNINNWRTVNSGSCGFENVKKNRLYSDDEFLQLKGRFKLNKKKACNGLHSIELNEDFQIGPKFKVKNVSKGDYIEIEVKRHKNKNKYNDKGELVLNYTSPDGKQIMVIQDTVFNSIGSKWEILRLNATIEHQPPDSTFNCYYRYIGKKTIYIDDFAFKHFSNQ